VALSVFALPNVVVGPLLRSPLRGLVSGSLLLVTVTGRKTGRRFTFPVLYAKDGRDIVIVAGWASKKTWWKNVIGGADVELLIGTETVRGRATAFVDDPVERGRGLRAYLKRFPASAKTLGAGKDFRAMDDATLGATQGDAVVVRFVPAS